MVEDISRALVAVRDAFGEGELAYLALTGKIELHVRDRLAWHLARSADGRFVVGREWARGGARVDLAILNLAGAPLVLMEAKALYTFNALSRNMDTYAGKMAEDAAKAHRCGVGHEHAPEVVLLLLATHTVGGGSEVAPGVSAVVKYGRAAGRPVDYDEACSAIRRSLESRWPVLNPVRLADGPGPMGFEVTVDGWLCGPIAPPERVQ